MTEQTPDWRTEYQKQKVAQLDGLLAIVDTAAGSIDQQIEAAWAIRHLAGMRAGIGIVVAVPERVERRLLAFGQ